MRLNASPSKLSFRPVKGSDAEQHPDRRGHPNFGQAEASHLLRVWAHGGGLAVLGGALS
jgi:hypothetical protein